MMVIRFDKTLPQRKINHIVTVQKQIIMFIVQTNKKGYKSENVMNALSFNMDLRLTTLSCLFRCLKITVINSEQTGYISNQLKNTLTGSRSFC